MKRFTRILAVMLALVLVFGSIPAQAASKSPDITTQSGLNEALTSGKYTQIVIKTSEKQTFKIPDGKYSKIDLYVKSAKATIENNAVFKSITVDDAATYTEKAVGNTIKVADKKLTLNVAKGAKVKTLTLAKKNAADSVNIEGEVTTLKVSSKTNLSLVNNGTLSKLYTYKGGELDISGTPSAKTKIYVKKTGATIKSVTPVKLYVYKAADITLETGAEGTTVNGKEDGAVISLKNGSGKKVTITEADGSKTSVSVGKSVTVGGSASETTPAPTATPVPTAVPTATPTPEPTATPTPTPEVKKLTVSQKATNVITISGDSVKSDIEKEDINIYTLESGIEISYVTGIQKLEYSEGTLTATMYSDFDGGKVFYIRIGSESASFTAASDNLEDVYRIEVVSASAVPIYEPTSIEFRYFDKNDVELTNKIKSKINVVNYESSSLGDLVITQVTGSDKAFFSGNQVTFTEEGATQITVSLIKNLDANYNPVKATGSGSIVGKKPQISSIIYTIAKDDGVYLTSKERNSVKHTLEIDDTVINSFEAIVALSDGTYKTLPELGYTVESADPYKLLVTGNSSSGGSTLYAISAGTVGIIINNEEGKPINSVTVEVRPARVPSSIQVAGMNGKNKLNTNAGVGDSIIIVATVKDQYGDTIEDPALTVQQKETTISTTGTVSLGSFTGGKLRINGTDVNITGTGNTVALDISCADNPSVKTQFGFGVKDVPYSSTEKYTRKAVVEGNRSIDTTLSLGTQENESTFVYLEYSKDGFFVREEAGKLLNAAPTAKLTAVDLGVAEGTTGLYFTIRNGTKYVSGSTANIAIDSNNIEFIPVAIGSKLEKGSYIIDFYIIKADAGSSVINRPDVATATITVVDSEPEFTYTMTAQKAAASGTWADILPKFYEFTWNGEKIPASCIIDAETFSSTSGNTVIRSVTFQFVNSAYGPFTVTEKLDKGNSIIQIQ